jgi:hypothetical protein
LNVPDEEKRDLRLSIDLPAESVAHLVAYLAELGHIGSRWDIWFTPRGAKAPRGERPVESETDASPVNSV